PDADTLFVGHGDDVIAFDRTTGKEQQRLAKVGGFGWYVQTLACAPDGRTLAVRSDAEIRLVDRATGRVVRRLPCGAGLSEQLFFAPDGRTLVDVGQDQPKGDGVTLPRGQDGRGRIRLWEVATGRERRRIAGPQTHTVAACFAPDGRTLAASHHTDGAADDTVRL